MLTDKEKNSIDIGCALKGLGERIQEELDAAAAIVTADLADGAVTVSKLASALQPSHVVKFAGTFTTVGGDADETITVTGALATDLVICQVVDGGTNSVTLLEATAAEDAVNLVLSADPSNDAIVNYIVLRAIA